MPYVAVIAIVAVVAVVLLVLNDKSSSVQVVDEEGNLVGEASRLSRTANSCSGWGEYCSKLLVGESRTYTLKGSSYKIALNNILFQDYAGGIHSADFVVNSEDITLLEGESRELNDGRFMRLTYVLSQPYAGGINGASFC